MRLPKKWDAMIFEDLKYNDGRLRLLLYLFQKSSTPVFVNIEPENIKFNQPSLVFTWVETMASDLNVSVPSIRRWLKILIDRGYIKRDVGYCRYIVNRNY